MSTPTPDSPWRQWYGTSRWRRRADYQKKLFPLCAMCLEKNQVVAAEVADHIEPHRGDPKKFWFGDLQSLCMPHHNRSKQQLETKGYVTDIGDDGWPVDPNHPTRKLEK